MTLRLLGRNKRDPIFVKGLTEQESLPDNRLGVTEDLGYTCPNLGRDFPTSALTANRLANLYCEILHFLI